MTAPVATIRQQPVGRQLPKGYQTLITFASSPTIAFWEQEVTPPGLDGGDSTDTTNQFSDTWVTKSPGTLVELTDMSVKVGYDPKVIVNVASLINVTTTVTIRFPDGSTIAAYGYLKSFAPGALTRSGFPDATITIVFTNMDPVTCVEEGPVYTAGSGTSRLC